MAKTKTLGKHEGFSRKSKSKKITSSRSFDLKTLQEVKLKPGASAKLEDHNPDERLRDVKLVQRALLEALLDGDHETFKAVLRAHLETVNKDELSGRSGVARSTLFRMLAPSSNPTLKNVARVCRMLKAG